MSSFLGGASWGGLGTGVLASTVDTAMPPDYCWNFKGRQASTPWQDGLLWSASRFNGGTSVLLGQDASEAGVWSSVDRDFGYDESGGQQRKKIIGTCRDDTGAALGSCIVQGFRTSDDADAGSMTCDTGGYFEFCTQYTQAHYLVAYKAGSPDVAGTTVNTLVGV